VQLDESNVPAGVTVNGDMWCDRNLDVYGTVHGDVFANGAIQEFGTIDGKKKTGVVSSPAGLPSLSVSDYETVYYIGAQSYLVEVIDPNDGEDDLTLGPSGANPAGIFYCDDHLDLNGVTTITGTLVVNGDLRINDKAVTITAVKNFPALLVDNNIEVSGDGAVLNVTGLTQIGGSVALDGMDNCVLNFTGALHVLDGMIEDTGGAGTAVNITADPMAAALKTWSSDGSVEYWMPAGGSFFRSISRD
jgi:cytoskeletal protein CcmA (bactofilin family)